MTDEELRRALERHELGTVISEISMQLLTDMLPRLMAIGVLKRDDLMFVKMLIDRPSRPRTKLSKHGLAMLQQISEAFGKLIAVVDEVDGTKPKRKSPH